MTSPRSSMLGSRTTTTSPVARRRPMLEPAPLPSRSDVTMTSARSAEGGQVLPIDADGSSATTTMIDGLGGMGEDRIRCPGEILDVVGRGDDRRYPTPVEGFLEATRDGLRAPVPQVPPTSTSGGWAGSRRKSVPASTTRQPAISISSRRRSAVAQSRAARAWLGRGRHRGGLGNEPPSHLRRHKACVCHNRT